MATIELTPTGASDERLLTKAEFRQLAEVPPEIEWFAQITNPHTRRAYRNDLRQFMAFVGIHQPTEFRDITRAHVLAWRKDLERRQLAPVSIRRKLSAISDLMDYLCDANAITHNPVNGVRRPSEVTSEGKTPAISDDQARALIEAPPLDTLKGKRDRAIIAVLLYHALRRSELCALRVKDVGLRRGLMHQTVHGKRGKLRFIPVHPKALALLHDYLDVAGHAPDPDAVLFRAFKKPNSVSGHPLSPSSIYWNVVLHYAQRIGLFLNGFGPHSLRATAATNALDHHADIAKVQEWLGQPRARDRTLPTFHAHFERRVDQVITFLTSLNPRL